MPGLPEGCSLNDVILMGDGILIIPRRSHLLRYDLAQFLAVNQFTYNKENPSISSQLRELLINFDNFNKKISPFARRDFVQWID